MVSICIVILFQFFHICVYHATLIIRYDEAPNELSERIDSGFLHEDFLRTYDTSQKEQVCKEVLAAREYVMIPPLDLSEISASKESTIKDQDKQISLGGKETFDVPLAVVLEAQDIGLIPSTSSSTQKQKTITVQIPPKATLDLNQEVPSNTSTSGNQSVNPEHMEVLPVSVGTISSQTSLVSISSSSLEATSSKGTAISKPRRLKGSLYRNRAETSRTRELNVNPLPMKSLLQTRNIRVDETPLQRSKYSFQYREKKVSIPGHLGQRSHTLKCLDTEDKTWYVMYGLRQRDLFLLETRLYSRGLAVTALITQTPIVRDHGSSPSKLLTSFLRQLEFGDDRKLRVPRMRNFCFFTKSAHLRLCAATFEALVSSGLLISEVQPVNSVTVDASKRCLTKIVQMNEELFVRNVRVVPCSVNKFKDYADSQFYVLPDFEGTASSFIMTSGHGQDQDVISVIAKVEYVDILYGIDFNSEFIHGRPSNRTGMGSKRIKKKNQS